MSCEYCSVFARHPCTSRQEASTCANNSNRGGCMDFNARDVAEWIRYNANGNEELEAAAELIEKEL